MFFSVYKLLAENGAVAWKKADKEEMAKETTGLFERFEELKKVETFEAGIPPDSKAPAKESSGLLDNKSVEEIKQ